MCRLFLMTVACLMVLFGTSGLWMMPKLVQQKIEQQIQLKIGTKSFERFLRVPIPLTVKFYLFNVTNAEQVLAGLERPQFQEVGPFMYKQWRRREVVDFEDYNRRLRYREIKTFYPMYSEHSSNTSAGDVASKRHNSPSAAMTPTTHNVSHDTHQYLNPRDFNVTLVNVPLLSVLTKLANIEEGTLKRQLAARVAIRLIADGRDKILITKPANELLFDGYRVDFMESARDLVSETLGFNFDSPLPGNKFGFFFGKNGTWNRRENGELTVFTGRNDSMKDFMLVDNWNDQRRLSVWPSNTPAGDRCNEIRGTDGSQFHPGVTREQVLSIFSPMVCTSLHIKYKEDTACRDIPLLRFTTPPDLFAAPRKNPRNACYCTIQPSNGPRSKSPAHPDAAKSPPKPSKGIDDSRCYTDGLMDLSLCQRGAPIAASSPHFYNGDPLLAMAAGTRPRKEIHETYIDIEPMTGAVMRAASRAQLNAYVERAALEVVDAGLIGNMTPMVAPLLWLEESAEIDEKSSREFKGRLLNLVQRVRRSSILAIAGGILLACLVALEYWWSAFYLPARRKSADPKSSKRLLSQEMTDARRRRVDSAVAAAKASLGKQSRDNLLFVAQNARGSNLAAKQRSEPAAERPARNSQRRHERAPRAQYAPIDADSDDDARLSRRPLVPDGLGASNSGASSEAGASPSTSRG